MFLCADKLSEPLEDGCLSLGVNSETDGFFHGAVDDGLCDAALLAAGSFLLCFGSSTVFKGV